MGTQKNFLMIKFTDKEIWMRKYLRSVFVCLTRPLTIMDSHEKWKN